MLEFVITAVAMGRPARKLIGQRFGRILVLERAGSSSRGAALWRIRCDCGRERSMTTSSITCSVSCGCVKATSGRERLRTHGLSKTGTYASWLSMKERCLKPRTVGYPYYGGRGITVCDRWVGSFENFLADMGERPAGMTLDRIDSNGHYEPGNCRWNTPTGQARNRSSSKLVPDNILAIREMARAGMAQRAIARQFGIQQCTVREILAREIWRDVG